MTEKIRKPIGKRKKLPQFTIMNVIEGQAGLENYSSLFFYSLTIDNILNIIVLLILAGIAISLTIGQNGIINRAKDAVEIYEDAGIREKEGLNDLAGEIDKHANAGISNDKNRYQDMINKYTNLQELLYTARSGLSDIFSKLQNIRMELLEVKQSNDENGEHQNAVNQYLSEIDNVANTVSYDNIYLLNGFLETPFVEEIDDYNWTLQIDGCKTEDLGINNLNEIGRAHV